MHFGFVLKCKNLAGEPRYYAAQAQGSTRKEAERKLLDGFQKHNVYAPGCCGEAMTLEVVLECGECADGGDAHGLYEKACKKADKLTSGARKDQGRQEVVDVEICAG
jgi:hypothetical protein